jgi:hypothetical protein
MSNQRVCVTIKQKNRYNCHLDMPTYNSCVQKKKEIKSARWWVARDRDWKEKKLKEKSLHATHIPKA